MSGTLAGSSPVFGAIRYSLALNYNQFKTLGTYYVTAAALGAGGAQASCPSNKPAFFAIVNDSGEPANLNGKSTQACGSAAGSWNGSLAKEYNLAADLWSLQQTGNTVSRTFTSSVSQACGNMTWTVSGSLLDGTHGTFSLLASSPVPAFDACGYEAALTITINTPSPLTISGPACDSASATEVDTFATSGPRSYPSTLTTTAQIPTGEKSQFDQWAQWGYPNQALFVGMLNTTSASQFAGRTVSESSLAAYDQCWNLDLKQVGNPVTGTTGGSWTILSNSTYTDDWIGYGPSLTRYYQTFLPACNFTVTQQMSISSDGGVVPYHTNNLKYALTPSQVTATRDTQTKSETFP